MKVNCSKSYDTYLSYTTTNVQQTCLSNAEASIACKDCTCGNSSSYNSQSVQYQFALQNEQSVNNATASSYCSLSKMTKRIETKASKDTIIAVFNNCYNSSFAFLVISGLVILLTSCVGFRGILSLDGFGMFVYAVVALHVLGDVPQSIVAIVFTVYKQGDCDCLISWSKDDFGNLLYPPVNTHGHTILDIVSQYPNVALFLGFAFAHVFISGALLVRIFGFDTQKLCEYPWVKTLLYFFAALLCGVISCLIIFAPFWGACWSNADQLEIGGSNKKAILYTFITGMTCWGLLICSPICVGIGYSIAYGAGCACLNRSTYIASCKKKMYIAKILLDENNQIKQNLSAWLNIHIVTFFKRNQSNDNFH
ncbi:hypothetical protein RFI_40183 [Reticulomyxa filosa]|uniref:Transmembrane protein n=1 Tax=Reticulomyxa filosa TaxID=46433 RepID=X6L7M0_RETFI|nr:hypothetical protein RFI_40183 [Reticulomyxa filosa]|eukprot:ETN97348.1 hypothetical protein RFI_40183 [Reticulomyxa filosa]